MTLSQDLRNSGKRVHLYLAGPMTGLPEFNYPAFHAAATNAACEGFIVHNPASLNLRAESAEHRDAWAYCMKQALKMMMQCDAILMLDGWADSKGAKIEWNLAQQLNFQVYYEGDL